MVRDFRVGLVRMWGRLYDDYDEREVAQAPRDLGGTSFVHHRLVLVLSTS